MSAFGFDDFSSAIADVKSSSVLRKSPPAGGTGGERGSPPPSSPYSSSREIIPRVWSADLCGGCIGGGDFVCCLPRAVCQVAVHKSRPSGIEEGTIFIPDSGNKRFHKDYTLVLQDYPMSIQKELCRARSGHEHRRLFDLVKRSKHSDLEALDSETLQEFFKIESARCVPATPGVIQETVRKPRFQDKLKAVDEEGSEDMLAALSAFEAAILEISDPISPGSEDTELFLANQVPKLRTAFATTSALVKKLYGVVTDNKDAMEASMVEIFGRVESNLSEVYAVIGNYDKHEDELQAFGFDLASALGGVAQGLKVLRDAMGLSEEDETPPTKKLKLLEEVAAVRSRVSELEKAMREEVSAGFKFLIPEVKKLQSIVVETGTQSQGLGLEAASTDDSKERMEKMEKLTMELLYEMGTLKASVATLELKKDPIPEKTEYKLGGRSFATIDDAKVFLAEGGAAGNDPGFFVDCFSVGAIAELTNKSMEEMMKLKALTLSSGMPDSLNAVGVLMSFGLDRPPIVGTSAENKDRDVPLPRVKTYDDWYHPSTGTKTVLSRYDDTHDILEKHLAGFADMARLNPRLTPIVEVAAEMLSKSKKFIQELSRQVDSFRNMVLADSTSSSDAWLLIAEMLGAVFFEINKARTPFGTTVSDHGDVYHRCALVLIGTFRAHAKMEEIWRAGFTKHPCVSTCLSLHLFSKKASQNSMSEVQKQVKEQGDAFKTLAKSVQSQLDQVKRGQDKGGNVKPKPAA